MTRVEILREYRLGENIVRGFFRKEDGGTALFVGTLAVLGIGAAALTIDLGRIVVLKTQMQNRVDSSALAGAKYLDRTPGARERAELVARNSIKASSAWPANGNALNVKAVKFYAQYGTTKVLSDADENARYIEIELEPRRLNYFFQPILNYIVKGSASDHAMVKTRAVADSDPYICHAPPLMVCDPSESDPTFSFNDPLAVGRMVRMKAPQGGNALWAPGNFGLLATTDGDVGANAIAAALRAVQPTGCYTLSIETAPGSKTNQVKDGINARFDLPDIPGDPAPNVIVYPRDASLIASEEERFGDGAWDPAAYWLAKHGGSLPAALADASRYQVYLYELGLTFLRNGKQTLYPVPDDGPPDGFTTVIPPGIAIPVAADPANADDPNYDGVPTGTVASNGYARRLVQVAVLKCVADNVRGNGTYPTQGVFAEFFITEDVKDPPDAAIYGEFVRRLTPSNTPAYHGNVRLVE